MGNPAPPSSRVRLFERTAAVLLVVSVGTVLFYVNSTLGLYSILDDDWVDAFNGALVYLVVGAAALVVWKRISLRVALPFLTVTTAFLMYLAWDDASTPSAPEIPPLAAVDAKNFTTYRWLLKTGPGTRRQELPKPKVDLPTIPAKEEEWPTSIRANRTTWDSAWAEDTLGREWLTAMAEQPFEGVYPNEGISTPMLDFSRVRRAVKCHWARALLLSGDGHTDESVQLLSTVLRAAYLLQRSDSSLVGQMMATVCTKGTYQHILLRLDAGTLSTDAKTRLFSLLNQAPEVRQNLALAFVGEEITARSAVARAGQAWQVAGQSKPRFTPSFAGQLLLTPNRSERQYVEFLREVSTLAQNRQLETSAAVESLRRFQDRRSVKNPVGQLLSSMVLPAFNKVTTAFWETDDRRIALLNRLKSELSSMK